MFNVSDNAVRKWCKKYDLPYTKKRYFKLFKISFQFSSTIMWKIYRKGCELQ